MNRSSPIAPSPRQVSRARRGGNAIEFALLLPVFIAVVAFIFEYGWYFFVRASAMSAVQAGCRAGAVVPPDDVPAPADVASDSIKEKFGGWSFFGIDCADTEDDRCQISINTVGTSPSEMINCSMSVNYPGLTGAIPVPDQIHAGSVFIFELQR